MSNPFDRLSPDDRDMAASYLGGLREPDLIIAPDGEPYLYRWHLTPHSMKDRGAAMLHIQIASDPERPLHDHPWDNQSVILSGGYDELWNPQPWISNGNENDIIERATVRKLRMRDVVARKSREAHRLILPNELPYTMSLFSVGPVLHEWGFWTDNGWLDARVVTQMTPDGRSIFRGEYAKP